MLEANQITRLKDFVIQILENESPEEVDIFELIGEDVIRSSKTQGAFSSTEGGFEFGPPAMLEHGMLALHLAAGTLALFEVVISMKKIVAERQAEKEIQQLWKECLIGKGLHPDAASRIPIKFTKDVAELLSEFQSEVRADKEPTKPEGSDGSSKK